MIPSTTIRIGTRGSALARWQAEWVADQLRRLGHDVALVPIATLGDQRRGSIGELGETGLFTKEIQRALVDGRVDLAVHSLKDLPTELTADVALAAVSARETAADALVSRDGNSLDRLPEGARIGTGSLRRRSQLKHTRPDLVMLDIRGNVETRLAKLDDGQFDAIVLAEAGLKRLGLSQRISQVLPMSLMLPAIGQGALALETRTDDVATRHAAAALDDPGSRAAATAERALLSELRGGCLAPIGGWGRVERSGRLVLDAVVLSADGSRRIAAKGDAAPAEAAELGRRVAQDLLRQGAAGLIAAARVPAGPQ